MADGKRKEAWNHTAQLLALQANINRDPNKTSPITPQQIHPYYASQAAPAAGMEMGSWSELKGMLKPGG